jgi:hypothetical protein
MNEATQLTTIYFSWIYNLWLFIYVLADTRYHHNTMYGRILSYCCRQVIFVELFKIGILPLTLDRGVPGCGLSCTELVRSLNSKQVPLVEPDTNCHYYIQS